MLIYTLTIKNILRQSNADYRNLHVNRFFAQVVALTLALWGTYTVPSWSPHFIGLRF